MFENFSNVIFIAVALAVFIGRTIAQARKKREAEESDQEAAKARPASPRVPPVHFEDDDDYIPGYLKKPTPQTPNRVAAKSPKKQSAAKVAPVVKSEPTPPANVDMLFSPARPSRTASSDREGFSFNLDHLSPMKQAVLMAEILGTPKGMQ